MAPMVLGGGRQLPVGKRQHWAGKDRREEGGGKGGQWGWHGQSGQSRVQRAKLNILLLSIS